MTSSNKFLYDENGSLFQYFFQTLIGIILTFSTWYCLSLSTDDEIDEKIDSKNDLKNWSNRCRCEPCKRKLYNLTRSRSRKFLKNWILQFALIIAWIVLIYKFYLTLHINSNDTLSEFNPFNLLQISKDATKAQIKSAYHRLSLIYHPDRETGDEVRFIAISKAYSTLTDAKAYQNWLDYGNPDGPGVTILGIALPAWIISNENAYIILALYGSLLLIGLPLWVNWWWSKCLSSSDSIAMPSSDQKGSKIIPETIQMFMWTLYKKPSMNIATILNTIAASLEFNPLFNCNVQTRKSDNLHIPELIQRLPVAYQINREKVKGELSPLQYPYAIKTRALLLAHLNRLELSSRSLQFDLRYIQPKSLHVIQCFINCIVQLTFFAISGRIEQRPSLETLEHAIKLSQLIVQALAFDKSSLLQIPHLTEEIIRNRKFNVQTIRQLASLSDVERRHLLRRLNDDQYLDVCNMIGSLPLLDIDAQCGPMDESIDQEDMFHPRIITTKSLVAVYVTITRKPMSQLFGSTFTENDKFDESPAFISFSGDDGINFKEKFNDKSTIDPKQIISNSLNKCTNQVHCPLFNGIKHENWWIYISTDRKKIASTSTNNSDLQLITVPYRIVDLIDRKQIRLKFFAPAIAGSYQYTINVRSDSYVDLDYFASIKFDVHQTIKRSSLSSSSVSSSLWQKSDSNSSTSSSSSTDSSSQSSYTETSDTSTESETNSDSDW